MSQNQAVYFMNKWQLIKNLDECNLEEQEILGGGKLLEYITRI